MRITTRGGLSDRPHRYMSTVERFDAQHVPVPEAGCWLWTGTQVRGYGHFRANGTSQPAHRYALSVRLGRPLGAGMLACHKCDTPLCVNPDHLYEGTVADNARDSVERGQQLRGKELARTFRSRCHGVAHHSNRLTEAEVLEIRASAAPLSYLATRYGVSTTTIAKIRKCAIWKHIQPGESA